MATLNVMRTNGGWVVKREVTEPDSVIFERKTAAMEVARRLTLSQPEIVVLLHETNKPPEIIKFRRRRARLLDTTRA